MVGSSSKFISHVVSLSCNVYPKLVKITGCCTNRSPIVIRIHGARIAIEFLTYSGAVYPANAFNLRYIGFNSSRLVAYTVKSKLISLENPV